MLVYLVIALMCVHDGSTTKEPIVKIKNGKLLGIAHSNYYSFEGIPYAEPPIGSNRFESTKPFLEKWNGTRDATKFGQHCIQHPDAISRTYEINGVEDCLYLNIYTPDIKSDKLYPVVFYIHGGAFMFGSSKSVREKILMKHQNFVFVTFNYRLNIFGFLSTSDTVITGNMGLKDQRFALHWVKDNIRKFNGNPDKILIAGFSAGSVSVEYFTLQRGIENLAVAAISMSGSVLNDWAFNSNPKTSAIKLGQLLNCSTDNSTALKNCLKAKPALDIVSKVKYFNNFLHTSGGIFAPVAEHPSVKDAVLTKNPRKLLKKGKFSRIPHLLSYTAEDGALLTASIYNDIPEIIKSGKKYYLDTEPWLYPKSWESDLEKIYDYMAKDSIRELTSFLTDRLFKEGIIESINLRRQIDGHKTFLYKYDNPPPFGLGNLITGRNDVNFGTNHGDDVFLMFNLPPRDAFKFRPDEERISDNFIKMLESFVTTGIPQFGDIKIPYVTSDKFDYLLIKADDYQIVSYIEDNFCEKIEENFCYFKFYWRFKLIMKF